VNAPHGFIPRWYETLLKSAYPAVHRRKQIIRLKDFMNLTVTFQLYLMQQ